MTIRFRCTRFALLAGLLVFSMYGCSTIPEAVEAERRVQVLSAVLQEVAKSDLGTNTHWVRLSDSEFRRLKHHLGPPPSSFVFAQASPSTDVPVGEQILAVRYVKIRGRHADARVTFESKGGFADFLYKLNSEGGTWKVISREFICAS